MTFRRRVSLFVSASLILAASGPYLAGQVRVVDLTNTPPNRADWKIVASEAGGSLGSSQTPPSYVPVTVHLNNCAVRDSVFYYSVEIENSRKLELKVPVSLNSKLFDQRGTITFRELLIRLGTVTNIQDPSTFQSDLAPIELFGDQSVPGTLVVLAPGERLLLRLKSEAAHKAQELRSLLVNIGASDVTLSPGEDGYRKKEIWIPAFRAKSESSCLEPEQEMR